MAINWIKWGVIINFIMLIAIIISLSNITITLPSFEKIEHQLHTLEEPISSETLHPLKNSPQYYVELIIRHPSEIDYDGNLEFSVTLVDKGKKSVEEPEIRIFIVDSIGSIRGAYPSEICDLLNTNQTNLLVINDDIGIEEAIKGANFKFEMPPTDQKVIGYWKIFAYLFDKNSGEPVSYVIEEVKIREINPIQRYFTILVFTTAIVLILDTLRLFLKRKRAQ